MDIKKIGNIVFWIVVVGLAMITIYLLYNRFAPNTEVKVVPPQQSQSQKASNESAKATDNTSESTSEEVKKLSAPEFTLIDLSGKKVKLSDFKGKIVVLNFWATWCPYCVEEMPMLDKLSKELQQGKEAVILAIDVQESQKLAEEFVTKQKLTLPVLLDDNGSVAGTYGIEAFPTTIFIRSDGTVYGYLSGKTNEETIKKTIEKIKQE